MRRAPRCALIALVLATDAQARSPSSKPAQPHAPMVHFARPIPMLPNVSRVRVEVARDHVLQIEEIGLPRGEWRSGGLDLYVAFGAPGTPSAVDARLLAVAPGATDARVEDAGDPVVVEPATRPSPSAQLLLGRPTMAGFVVRVKEGDLRRVFETGDLAIVRLRSLLALPSAGDGGARDLVVRLGIHEATPLALGRIQVVSVDPAIPIARAEAHLCGPDADPWPLSVAVLPPPTRPAPEPIAPIAPLMAVRHPADDLCIRWWRP